MAHSFRTRLPEHLNRDLELILQQVDTYKESFMDSKEEGIAQVWVAITLLAQRISRLERQQTHLIESVPRKKRVKRGDAELRKALERY